MKNKTALVTGGAKGIGAAICRELANMGYNLAVNYNSSYEAAQSLKSELSQLVDVGIYKADVSDSTQVADMLDNIKKDFGGVDVLVNNAGIAQQALFTDITDEMWQRMIGTNLTGTFNCCRSVLPYMINQKNGVIINITSMWGQVGASMEVHYSAAKAGVIGLTKALAKEVGLSGIRVNAVSPGVVLTDMMAQFTDDDKNALKDETPLNRLGTPEDVAHTVAFLCSDKADFITGQIIPVNGGFII